MRKFILFVFLVLAGSVVGLAQTTTIFIVRHAEKNLVDPNTRDPDLSGVGLQRSYDLDKFLEKENITAILSTNYKRTKQTAHPLATRIGQEAIIYDPAKPADVVEKVKSEYKGKKVLIVGHSNTIIQMVRAFGGSTTMAEIKDTEYNHLFKVELNGDEAKTTELTYGN